MGVTMQGGHSSFQRRRYDKQCPSVFSALLSSVQFFIVSMVSLEFGALNLVFSQTWKYEKRCKVLLGLEL